MKEFVTFIFSFLVLNIGFAQTDIDGMYVGLEKICWRTSKTGECLNTLEPNSRVNWFHENLLKIKGDSAFLDQNPISIHKKDTAYSASDGAFYYYKGTVTKTGTTIVVNLTLLFCDYCAEIEEPQVDGTYKKVIRTKTLNGRITDKGIVFGNSLYKKTTKTYLFVSENSEYY